MKRSLFTILTLALLSSGCFRDTSLPPTFEEGPQEGFKPIYANDVSLEVELTTPKAMENPGQIYTIGDLLLIVENLEGIHIIDNEDPSAPEKVGFLTVKGCQQLSIKDGVLYTNQYTSLVAIDISDQRNIHMISRDNDVLSSNLFSNQAPPVEGYYFECPDEEKGTVVGWEFTTIESPKCYR
ncbi:hypothetical protein [Roseivirga pacifica]|uniref:hypothetical protein n=1 Tax=Roseivirga pacifica TaxID=1267423 RepID=UPI0020953649|nr:hypothetical protein [Roseivirga pacifica]MCO6357239.1 hypothetical protein [Roseivirga pacifica]MCO6368047.1 hypothetical protein [Roseivirga pacifica]MCO6369471.1 hypothetical protein [Roseivirga pacifica]MCO6373325.1 hypothetical protein [Roseivirga pacifica]MCO6377418.1 hypothetical protein [Roseivirga pacifica]|tara:strand:+ start:1443 stop:1988 length:546 start_codon:yes stop_codon:yes gene_type:complete